MGARVMELTFIFKRGNATLLVGHGGNAGPDVPYSVPRVAAAIELVRGRRCLRSSPRVIGGHECGGGGATVPRTSGPE